VAELTLTVFLTLLLYEMLFEISMTDKIPQGSRLSSIRNTIHFL